MCDSEFDYHEALRQARIAGDEVRTEAIQVGRSVTEALDPRGIRTPQDVIEACTQGIVLMDEVIANYSADDCCQPQVGDPSTAAD